MDHVAHHLSSAYIYIFLSKNQQFLLYQEIYIDCILIYNL